MSVIRVDGCVPRLESRENPLSLAAPVEKEQMRSDAKGNKCPAHTLHKQFTLSLFRDFMYN